MSTQTAKNPITPIVRLSYPSLFRARGFNGGEPKFSCSLIFDEQAQKSPEFKKLKQEAGRIAKEKWGDKLPVNMRSPFRDGAERDNEGYGPGVVFMNVSSKQRPGIVGTVADPETGKPMPIEDESELYAGCYVRAELRAYAYDTAGNKGVAFGLQNIQKVKDGDMLGNRTRAEDVFAAAEAHEGGVTGDAEEDELF